jgi:hypothetical protein
MKRLLLLLALASTAFGQTQVKLTWQQPPNPGWTDCGTKVAPMCLYSYVIVDMSTGQLFVAPVGTLTYSPIATPGTHNYAIWLGGIDAEGYFTSSMPPALTTVKVP